MPEFDIEKIRRDFPILKREIQGRPLVYLDNAATTQKPRSVIERISRYYSEENSSVHRGAHSLSNAAGEAYEKARASVARFINAASPEEIVFTGGTTASINLAAESFGRASVSEGDAIIVTEMEHHANLLPWQRLCQEKGARLRILPLTDEGELALDQLPGLLSERCKLLALTWVSNALGTVNPLEKIIAEAHAAGVAVLVDAAQAVQHRPVDVQKLDCDFMVFSGHKMYAATGIGVLYAKKQWLDELPPWQLGGGIVRSVSTETASFADAPARFEAGTPNTAAALSLESAIHYLEAIGMETIAAREHELLACARRRLTAIPDLILHAENARKDSVLSCTFAQQHPYDVGMILDKLGIAVRTGQHCAEPVMRRLGINGTLRISLGLYSTETEIDYLGEALERALKMLS